MESEVIGDRFCHGYEQSRREAIDKIISETGCFDQSIGLLQLGVYPNSDNLQTQTLWRKSTGFPIPGQSSFATCKAHLELHSELMRSMQKSLAKVYTIVVSGWVGVQNGVLHQVQMIFCYFYRCTF